MKNKKSAFAALLILLTGILFITVQAQPKKGTNEASFSGKWKARRSYISMGKQGK
jgi:hypothetical protein